MTISTATTAGQILTSAYVNNNINSGLVYVASTTVSGSPASVTLSNAFTSEYDIYMIVFSNVACTIGSVNMNMSINTVNTGCYGSFVYQTAVASTVLGANAANTTTFLVGYAANTRATYIIDGFNPRDVSYKAGTTRFAASDSSSSTGGSGAIWSLNTTANATSVTFAPASGTFNGHGTITCYGYRKA